MPSSVKVEVIYSTRDQGLSARDPIILEDKLNERLAEGWLIAQVLNYPPHGWLVFYQRT